MYDAATSFGAPAEKSTKLDLFYFHNWESLARPRWLLLSFMASQKTVMEVSKSIIPFNTNSYVYINSRYEKLLLKNTEQEMDFVLDFLVQSLASYLS